MCRLAGYIGRNDERISSLIIEPNNALVKQSRPTDLTNYQLHGDGVGVSWYTRENQVGLYKSIQPAWNDQSFSSICRHITSHCFLGHVRASTVGHVSEPLPQIRHTTVAGRLLVAVGEPQHRRV